MDQDFWDIWYGRPTVHLIHQDAVRLGRKVGLSVIACRFYVISTLCFFIYKTGFSDPDFFFTDLGLCISNEGRFQNSIGVRRHM